MENVNVRELVLGGGAVDVALFIVCPNCQGAATYKHTLKGGPYGTDRTYDENCRTCYKDSNGKASGKQMVKIPLAQLVTAIRDDG